MIGFVNSISHFTKDVLMKRPRQDVLYFFLAPELKEWLREYAHRHNLTMTTTIKVLLERERAKDSVHDVAPLFTETAQR